MDIALLYLNFLPLAKLKKLVSEIFTPPSEILTPPSDSLELFGGFRTDCRICPLGRATTISSSKESESESRAGCFPFAVEEPTRFALDSCLAKERSTLCNLTCVLFGARHRSWSSAA